MLHQDNKYVVFCVLCFVLCVLCFTSCTNKGEINKKTRLLCYEKSYESIRNKEVYMNIYDESIDSIKEFSKHNLNTFAVLNDGKWQMDSLLCFSKKGDKLISLIIVQGEAYKLNNSLIYLYGVKVRDRWHFFAGPTVFLFSERYGLPPETPLSFEKMEEIATANIYKRYLKKNKKGEWEINDDFFSDLTSAAWSTKWQTNTPEQWDSIYLGIVRKKWTDHRKAQQKAIEDKRKAEIMKRYYESLKK